MKHFPKYTNNTNKKYHDKFIDNYNKNVSSYDEIEINNYVLKSVDLSA
jgi:hypothetical protein